MARGVGLLGEGMRGMKKVLVWGLTNNRAGTEAVIVNYASNIDDVSFDFLCYEDPSVHWNKLDRNGNRYFVIPSKIKNPLAYWRAIGDFMKEHAREYDVLWFNVNDAANIDPLKYAVKYGIPKRIVHMHSSRVADAPLTRFFHGLNRKKLVELATDLWACSDDAAAFLGGDGEIRIVANVIDAGAVSFSEAKRRDIRSRLGLTDAHVIGFVGRLVALKRPEFLIELMPRLLQENPEVRLVIVGAGELEDELVRLSDSLGVSDKVYLVGSQEDMQGYLSAFDVYAQPSCFEGFGISILEAQMNGLACVVSDAVPNAVDVTDGIQHIPTTDVDGWTEALLRGDRAQVHRLSRAKRHDVAVLSETRESLF